MERGVNSELVAKCLTWAECVIQSKGEPFTTTEGSPTKIYFNLRRLPSFAILKRVVMDQVTIIARELKFDYVVGVPQAGNVYATSIADRFIRDQLFVHPSPKSSHGISEIISGIYNDGQTALVVEDTSNTGSGILKTARLLKEHGLEVRDSIAILDRQEGARENIEAAGIRFHALTTAPEVLRWANKTIDKRYLSE